MPAISFENVSKSYGKTSVIQDISLDIADNEFLVLLGPSGCGKSTLLRMIAGLTDITDGAIKFDGAIINQLEPGQRDVAFVFQSYALYPHMTVRQNIAFPLVMAQFRPWHRWPVVSYFKKRQLTSSPEIAGEVERVARIMGLSAHLNNYPRTLSGGQRQRVAVARALVKNPSVYLMDEPLSNLDAQLRTQMRAEISALYQRVRKSFIYVTHDQVEAMTMGTRIVVMNGGVVQQYGTPEDIYDRPANTFVAGFVGSPPMNLITCTIDSSGLRTLTGERVNVSPPPAHSGRDKIILGIRSEDIRLTPHVENTHSHIDGQITLCEQQGAETVVGFRLGQQFELSTSVADAGNVINARCPKSAGFRAGMQISASFDTAKMVWFDASTGLRLT